uniref:Uncharacterized protein n=2 Tax=Meloidogyne TaxID=189290 RepID=A0A6V7XU47_MELEN|nr:unnamed protein product [Meloidogyne enterolobii]
MEGIIINRSDRSSNNINDSSTPSLNCLNKPNNSLNNPSVFPMAFPVRATTILFTLLSVMFIMSFQHQAQAASLSIPVAQMIGESGLFERDDRDYRPLQFGKRDYRPLQFGKRDYRPLQFGKRDYRPLQFGKRSHYWPTDSLDSGVEVIAN